MGIDTEPRKEPAVKPPQSIRKFYESFVSSLSQGENPMFRQAPDDSVFKNMVGDEKPLLYIKDAEGILKKWLTDDELKVAREKTSQSQLTEEQLFDMFSFIVGGRSPSLRNLGVSQWTDLLPEAAEAQAVSGLDIVRRIFEFVDLHPNTSLTSSLADVLGLSIGRTQKFEAVNNGKKGLVILQGDSSWNRGKMFVWHNYRNSRSSVQSFSPFRSDGSQNIGQICDVAVAYQKPEGIRIARLNKIVFLLARHGLSEETTSETALDQIYMPPKEFLDEFFSAESDIREQQQQIENENFIINKGLDRSQDLIKQKKESIVTTILDMANKGELDGVIKSIE